MKITSPCVTAARRSVLLSGQFRIVVLVLTILALALFFPAASTFAKKKAPDHPIDLNEANEKELEELPGVGPTTAKAIIEFREKSGKFKRVDDLLVIRGISEAKLSKMRHYLVVGPPPPSPKPATALQAAPKSSPKKSQ
jgi:comEA protein